MEKNIKGNMKLSYTKVQKYLECPKYYDLYYNQYLRQDYLTSAMFFGGAVDEALNILLLSKKNNLTEEEKELIKKDPFEVFEDNFKFKTLNNEKIDVRTSLKVRYTKNDYNMELLTDEDIETLTIFMDKYNYKPISPLELRTLLEDKIDDHGFNSLDNSDRVFLNFSSWLTLRRKGIEIINSYKKNILPKIKEVISIQENVSLPNEDGDIIIGKIDLRFTMDDYDGIITGDNKTTSQKYSKNSVKNSEQLGIYQEYTEDPFAAYLTILKNPQTISIKNCLDCQKTYIGGKIKNCKICKKELTSEEKKEFTTQIIVDKVLEETKEKTFDNIQKVLYNIRDGNYPKDMSKGCFMYGRKCPYYDFCRTGKLDDLKDLKVNYDKRRDDKEDYDDGL